MVQRDLRERTAIQQARDLFDTADAGKKLGGSGSIAVFDKFGNINVIVRRRGQLRVMRNADDLAQIGNSLKF